MILPYIHVKYVVRMLEGTLLEWMQHWIHKLCTNIRLIYSNEDFRCKGCLGTARPIDGRPCDNVNINDGEPDGMLSAGG